MERPSTTAERVPPGQHVTRGWPVLHFGPVPAFDPAAWRLSIGGACERPFALSWEEFRELPRAEVRADFHCVTSWSTLDNRWSGVLLLELARRAMLRHTARFVRFSDGGHYDTTVPLEAMLEPEALLATEHDGRPLAAIHGGPVRAVIPSLYAWKSCKWVRQVEFLERDRLGFWERRGYHNGADPWKEQRLV